MPGTTTTAADAEPDSAPTKALTNWTIAARSFNAIVQQCARQPNPLKNYWVDCTRSARRDYLHATHALLTTSTDSHPACSAVLGRARALERQLSPALARDWRANRAFLTPAGYHGHPLLGTLNDLTNRVATRDTTRADRLTPAARRACADS